MPQEEFKNIPSQNTRQRNDVMNLIEKSQRILEHSVGEIMNKKDKK